MGCGGSKEKQTVRTAGHKYHANSNFGHAAEDGIQLYPGITGGPLTAKEYKERLVTSEGTQSVHLPRANYTIRYAYVSQRGYYPDSPDKPNQDSFCVHTAFNGDPEQHLFGVFDGHGDCGTLCSQFARDKVPLNLLSSAHFATNPALAFHQAMVATNLQCHRSDFDDSMSGTTAITVLIRGRSLLVANVGDSRAVLGERRADGSGYLAKDLSIDQTPYRRDECERVKAAGARVLTLDQIEGLKDPTVEAWTTEDEDDGDPPRLWFPNGMYPGTAFTRSIGDAAAERIGVFAEPELEFRYLSPHDSFLIIASDGVFEFISSQRVVDMVSAFDDPHEACLSVVAESYRLWLNYETRTDDITMIVLQFSGLAAPQQPPPGSLHRVSLTGYPTHTPNGTTPLTAAAHHQQQQQEQEREQQEQQAAAAAEHHQQQQQQQQQAGYEGPLAALGGGASVTHGLPLPLPSPPHTPGAAAAAAAVQHRHPSGLPVPLRGHLVEDIEACNLAPSWQQQQPPPQSLQQQRQPKPAYQRMPSLGSAVAAAMSATGDSTQQQQQQLSPPPEQLKGGASSGSGSSGLGTAAAVAAAAAALLSPEPKPDLGSITLEQYKMLEESLRNNFLFTHLSEPERVAVYKRMARVEVQRGQVVIQQGERGDHFYVAEKGVYEVMVATAPGPDLDDKQQLEALELQQQQQQQPSLPPQPPEQQQQQQQQQGHHRRQGSDLSEAASVAAGGLSGAATARKASLGSVLLDNDLMADIAANAADEAVFAAYAAEEQQQQQQQGGGAAAAAEQLGGPSLSKLSISSSVSQQQVGLLGGLQTEWGELVHTYVAPPVVGNVYPSFGELALLYGKPRAATVVAQSNGILWRLSRSDFRAAVQSGRADPSLLLLKCLKGCELLEPLTNGQLMVMADLMQPHLYADGEVIGQVGDVYDDFCIVAQGAVAAVVHKGAQQQQQQLAPAAASGSSSGSTAGSTLQQLSSDISGGREVLTMGPGAFFGERALLQQQPVVRPASMVAKGQTLLLSVTRRRFEEALGPLSTLTAQHGAWQQWLGGQLELLHKNSPGPKYAELLAGHFDPQTLEMRGVLWVLNEGLILASVEDPDNGVTMTARVISVELVEARGLSQAVSRMRRITQQLPPCLFVPHTIKAWHSPCSSSSSSSSSSSGGGQQHLQQCVPAVVAGEALATVGVSTLASLLQEGPLDERSAAYVVAMALLGLQHCHQLGIIYRGLSAITLLMTESGLVQLVDFRFATDRSGRCFTLCGVPEYLAPEVVGGTGHDESVDWWALGVLVYHLITGGTPFAQLGDDELRIYRRILRAKFGWPETPAGHDISADARDLVAQLLQRDPKKRLGMARGGVAKLQAHPWFRHINWEDLRQGRATVPLGLRERVFKSAAMGDISSWVPPPRGSLTAAAAAAADGSGSGTDNPLWLEEF